MIHKPVFYFKAELISKRGCTPGALTVGFHSNHGHPQSAGLHLPDGSAWLFTLGVQVHKSGDGDGDTGRPRTGGATHDMPSVTHSSFAPCAQHVSA